MNKNRRFKQPWRYFFLVFVLLGTSLYCAILAINRRTLLSQQLVAATYEGQVDTALHLLDQGADPNAPCEVHAPDSLWQQISWLFAPPPSGTVLHLAVSDENGYKGNHQMFRLTRALIARGADPRRRDSDGRTVLMTATLFGSPENLQAVIESGVDVNESNTNGRTALQWLKWKGDFMDPKFIPGYSEKIAQLKQAGAKD